MAAKPINLIDAHFQKSNLFMHLPVFDAIYYQGHPDGKSQLYKAVREEQSCTLIALSIIRQEEEIIWEAAEDILERCVWEASTRLQGVFTFDLLTFDFHNAHKNFNYSEFGSLIVNNSLKTPPGEQRLIKYSSAYGLLQKLVVERWGKITFKTSVEVYKDKPSLLYLSVKRLLKLASFSRDPVVVLLNDLSGVPLFDPADKTQQEGFAKIIESQTQDSIEFLPEVYIQDKNGVRELLSGSVIKNFV